MAKASKGPDSDHVPLLPEIVLRLSGVMEMLHCKNMAIQETLSDFSAKNTLRASDIEVLQSLDFNTQAYADLARFFAQMATEVPAAPLNLENMEKTLNLGQLRIALFRPEPALPAAKQDDVTLL